MLKWLDLKDNPLVPALKQAAGDCITPNDCALCAKKVVALLQSYESQLQRERQRVLEEEMKVCQTLGFVNVTGGIIIFIAGPKSTGETRGG